MGRIVADRIRHHYGRIPLGGMVAHIVFRTELLGADHRRAAAEREGGGFGRRIRRGRQPDGVWSARSGHRAVAGNHVVRGDVHGLRAGIGGTRRSQRGAGWVGSPAVLEACAKGASTGDHSGTSSGHAAAYGAAILDAAATGAGHSSQALILDGWYRALPDSRGTARIDFTFLCAVVAELADAPA